MLTYRTLTSEVLNISYLINYLGMNFQYMDIYFKVSTLTRIIISV